MHFFGLLGCRVQAEFLNRPSPEEVWGLHINLYLC